MNTNHFWLLNLAVDGPIPVNLIADRPEVIANRFHVVPHSLSVNGCFQHLADLVGEGFICAGELSDGEQLQITSGTELSYESIVAKNLDDNCVYFLTERGGAKWCSLAKPNWGRFYTQIGDTFDDHEVFLIEAGSETRMEELMLELRNRFEIIVSNERCLWPIVPWKATYWKELPHGFRLTVHARGMALPIVEYQWVSRSPWCEYGFKSSECLNLVRPGNTDVNRIEPLRG